jgi:hypothetical protein
MENGADIAQEYHGKNLIGTAFQFFNDLVPH